MISGVDFSPLMFETASRRNRKFIDDKRVRLHQGDFLTIDMHGEMFNKIFCTNFVYFLPNPCQTNYILPIGQGIEENSINMFLPASLQLIR